ncbi:MAG: hypothetical protein JNK05_05705 [Myxococcales bacterium]|nr:hypothetical protein [Myxococcales bacterium]
MKSMYLVLSAVVATAIAGCGALASPGGDGGPFARDPPVASVPCNGAACDGICVAAPGGGADIPGGRPRTPPSAAGSMATCQPFPPAYCRTSYSSGECVGAHAECCQWVQRACMFGLSIYLDGTRRYGSCPSA